MVVSGTCSNCGCSSDALRRCAGTCGGDAAFCGKDCQVTFWKAGHKNECRKKKTANKGPGREKLARPVSTNNHSKQGDDLGSRSRQSKATPTRPTALFRIDANDAHREREFNPTDGGSFYLRPPPEFVNGIEQCRLAFTDIARNSSSSSRSSNDEEEWYLFLRKSHFWIGDYGAGGKHNQMKRCWLICIARKPHDVYCFMLDGPLAIDHRATVPSNHDVCSCLAVVTEKFGKRPTSITVCPLGVAAFRTKHAKELASNLSLALGTGVGGGAKVSIQVPTECVELPDDIPGSICASALRATVLDAEIEPVWLTFQAMIEQNIEMLEEDMNNRNMSQGALELSAQLGGYHEKSRYGVDPSYGTNREATVSSLRDLFEACKFFQVLEPWNTLSNNEYLVLRDEKTGQEAYAMVCGYTEYEGRGINIFENLKDCFKSYRASNPSKCTTNGWMDRLQYMMSNATSFGTLDDISYLNLPLADEPNAENIPHWCRSKTGIPTGGDKLRRVWGTPPPHDRWPFLAKIVRAAALYGTDPNLALRRMYCGPIQLSASPVSLAGLTVSGELFPEFATGSGSSYM